MTRVNFDRVARPYRWLEYLTFGSALMRCRNAQLTRMHGSRQALLLGEGDGRFLARLLSANPSLKADVVDSSAAMLRLVHDRVSRQGDHGRVALHCVDASYWKPYKAYDLLVTHFFLDCFSLAQLEVLLDRLLPHALPDAQWVISEFAIPRIAVAAPLARGLIGLLYRAFGWLTGLRVRRLPDYAGALLRRGLILRQQRCYLAGLLCSQVWSLPDIHGQK